MEMKQVTCWFNWQEWKSVMDDAFSCCSNGANDTGGQKLSVARAFSAILAWEARDANLPPTVMCLKELLSAKLAQIDVTKASLSDVYAYQSSLAMNIVRFVNHITEPYQTNTFAKPIKAIGNMIGLPDWIVNLRHNATHAMLPSLEILENAREFLFTWLKSRYVDVYKEIALDKSMQQNIKTYIEDVFVDYMNARYKVTLMKAKKKKALAQQDESPLIGEKVEAVTTHFKNETFETLIGDGFMIPTQEQLNAIGIIAEEYIESENILIPKSLLNIWLPYLEYCNSTGGLISLLFQKLLNAFKLESDPYESLRQDERRSKFLLAWMLTLIKLNSYKNDKKNTKFHFELNFKEVLADVSRGRPNRLKLAFLQECSQIRSFQTELSSAKLAKLLALVALTNEDVDQTDQVVSNDDSYHMDTDQECRFQAWFDNELMRKTTKTTQKKARAHFFERTPIESNWTLIDEHEWNSGELWKIGLAEGQSYEFYNPNLKPLSHTQEEEEEEKSMTDFDSNEQASDESHCADVPLPTSTTEPAKDKMKKLRTTSQATSTKVPSILKSNSLNQEYIELLKKQVYDNYWELS